jgi:molybdopterin-guanine dinucleotide biosynthesis protein A
MSFSAVVLAGGRSERMGRDKAWLRVEGECLLTRQLALVKASGAEEIFISGRPEVDYSAFRHPVLLDSHAGCGPLGGIERALGYARHKLVLVLAVDLPYLGAGLVETLLARCAEEVGAVPVSGDRIEPLVAFYPTAAHPIACSRLQQGRYAARDFAEECYRNGLVANFPLPSALRDFTNWNCPEDAAVDFPARAPV